MSDGKYFSTTKKGETAELRADLNSFDKVKVKDAVKKVIAAMTVGKDVSPLFPDVIKSMQTDNIELKKLVYLYIINYARSQPDKAILVVNAFQKDAKSHPNPLVRALAIRTMGCIRVDRITEYLCDPLSHALTDKDPYVRKTAAVCTAKLFDINSELVEERGFIDKLRELISDPNPMVVANAVASLAEISASSGVDHFRINTATLQKLLTALNECTEWGQVFILDALAAYNASPTEAETICERVTPRLQHANAAVVMSAIKVVMRFLDIVQATNPAAERALAKKLAPPLITLLSGPPEIQYVALRNIHLIVQKRPTILQNEVRVFFCKYNDAPYVKYQKLEIMIKLANARNIDQVLLEFKEYAQEVDVDFVRKAVRAIGRCAIKLESAAQKCINVLLELIKTRVNYVVQEAVVVIKDIFRRYPGRFEKVIVALCECLDTLDEPEAKAAMVWIVGEYAERIDDAADRLQFFIDTFQDESAAVQLQLLTATVKLFLKKPDEAKDMVTQVLDMATEKSDNPDLRDRGYVYWRLLSTDPAAAKQVVLAERPVISDDTFQLPAPLLDNLIGHISTLASVYHKPPEAFVKGQPRQVVFQSREDLPTQSDSESSSSDSESESESDSEDDEPTTRKSKKTSQAPPQQPNDLIPDLLGLGMDSSNTANTSSNNMTADPMGLGDIFGTPSPQPAAPQQQQEQGPVSVLSADKGNGVAMAVSWTQQNGQTLMRMHLHNQSPNGAILRNIAVRFNKNFLGLNQSAPADLSQLPCQPGQHAVVAVPVEPRDPTVSQPGQQFSSTVQVAIKTDLGVAYFQAEVGAQYFFEASGRLERKQFLSEWKEIPNDKEQSLDVQALKSSDADQLSATLEKINVFYIAKRRHESSEFVYFSVGLKATHVLVEVTLNGSQSAKICVKSNDSYLSQVVLRCIHKYLV